jgi:hypothetical protein
MSHTIVTKFAIGTEQVIHTLLGLASAIATERFAGKITGQELQDYINKNFNKNALMVELNSMSNQYFTVYRDNVPAVYARVTYKGERPEIFKNRRTLARIADFGVLAITKG